MLKILGMAVFGIALLFVNSPKEQTAKQNQETDNSPSQPLTIIDNSVRQDAPNTPAQKTPESHTGIEWSNWALVLIAGLTGLAVWKQARESAEATIAMKRSIEVQEAEFVQWLDIGNWEVENIDDKKAGWSRSGTQIQNHPGTLNFRISFPLVNNSPRPLFIHSVRTKLEIGSEETKKEFLLEEPLQLPPKSEYKVVIDTELTYDNVTEWLAYAVPILSIVDVRFSNALGRREEARFERLVTSRWGPDGETRTMSKGHKAKQADQ